MTEHDPAVDEPKDAPASGAAPATGAAPASGASRLFDLRLLIGGLFTLYGLVVGVVGLLDSKAEIDKAAGVRINLWMGIGMLVLGLFFLAWVKAKPQR